MAEAVLPQHRMVSMAVTAAFVPLPAICPNSFSSALFKLWSCYVFGPPPKCARAFIIPGAAKTLGDAAMRRCQFRRIRSRRDIPRGESTSHKVSHEEVF